MDIVVTIPKSEYINNDKERKTQKALRSLTNEEYFGFRVFNRKPNVQAGDRIYFVRDNIVSYSKEIFDVAGSVCNLQNGLEIVCDVTGRTWNGKCAVYFRNERDESYLNIQCKWFQGFRYKWWQEGQLHD